MHALDPKTAIEQAFFTATGALDTKKGPLLLQELLTCYAEPHRAYHNAYHIADMLAHSTALREVLSTLENAVLTWAILYHDIIYEPRSSANEEKSAELAIEALASLKAERQLQLAVAEAILATKHHDTNGNVAVHALLDLDLRILGSAPVEYRRYAEAIREEYVHIPDNQFNTGRVSVLHALLARDPLYQTGKFRGRYEAAARRNLEAELRLLS